jgi:cell fate regulator YaaT (PSP1 superfamily)
MTMPPEDPITPTHPLVVGVRLRQAGSVYDFDPGSLVLHRDDRVLVETEHGPTLGTVVLAPTRRPTTRHLRRVVKLADARDLSHEDRALQQERERRGTALRALRASGVPAKLVRVETSFDGLRTIVFVAGEDKLELRDVARDLGQALGTRIEVKQIGARDEARVAGGVGVCGRELCCSSWLKEFQAVSVKMVKAQGLSLNPAKLAGQCGRLKCCLRYEYQTYVELKRDLPAIGSMVESAKGNGKVVAQSILKQTVTILLDGEGGRAEATLEDLVSRRPDA